MTMRRKILTLHIFLEQHDIRHLARFLDGGLDLCHLGQADRDAAPLLAARRLDDDLAAALDEFGDLVGTGAIGQLFREPARPPPTRCGA